MIRFVLSFAGWHVGVALAMLFAGRHITGVGAAAAVLVPASVFPGLFAAMLIERRAPRRAFHHRARCGTICVLRGVAAGMLSTLLLAAGVVLLRAAQAWTDPVVAALASAAACSGVVLTMPRLRPNRCVRCDYDLSGSRGARCSECGSFDRFGAGTSPSVSALPAVQTISSPARLGSSA